MTLLHRTSAFGVAISAILAAPRIPSPAAAAIFGCDSLAIVAAEAPDSWFTTVPQVTHAIIPPVDRPKDVKTANIVVTILVDSAGKPVADSITVTGTTDTKYVQKIQKSFRNFRFRPATKGECNVPGRFRQAIQFQR